MLDWPGVRLEKIKSIVGHCDTASKGSESPTRMANSGHRKEELCVKDFTEFNLQGLVTDGIKREERRENFCGG